MADELAVALGHDREAVGPAPGAAQGVDELADDGVAEGALDQGADRRLLPGPLGADRDLARLGHSLDYDKASEPGSSGQPG